MISVLISIFLLGLLVIVHEAGHFVVARWSGVRVLRFSVGFGPQLLAWKRGHTEYAVSAIPLGGYVKMAGEQRSEHSAQPWEYLSKSLSTRARIVLAGPFVNYLVALVSLWVVFVTGYPQLLPVVGKVVEGTPAQMAGLQSGDRIQGIGSHAVHTWEEMTAIIYQSPDQPLAFQIERAGKPQAMTLTPKPKTITDPFGNTKTVGQIGIGPSGEFRAVQVGPVAAIGCTIQEQNKWFVQTTLGLWSLVTRKLPFRESVTGPIGIVSLISQAASEFVKALTVGLRTEGWASLHSEAVRLGFARLVLLTSFISFCLSIFNLFPVPILDGGHLFFMAIEKLRGVPVSLKVQERSAQVSFVLLITMVLVVCVNDVSRFGWLDKVAEWLRP